MLHVFALVAALADAKPSRAQLEFQEWSKATADGLTIVSWGAVDLDHDDRNSGAFAHFCRRPDADASWTVLGDDKGRKWVVEWPHGCYTRAVGPDLPPWDDSGHGFEMGSGPETFEFGISNDDLEVVVETLTSKSIYGVAVSSNDWIDLVRKQSSSFGMDGPSESAIVVVSSPQAAKAGPIPRSTHVVSGREAWGGDADASLAVSAAQVGEDTVELVIQVRDDVRIHHEAPDDLVDQLELRWCRAESGCSSETNAWYSLLVGWSRDGSPVLRWGNGSGAGAELPDGRARDGRLVISVPVSLLARFPQKGEWEARFAVIFSDVDRRGQGVESVVATSDLVDSGRTTTMGLLVRYPDLHRFPTHTRRVREALGFTSITKLDPGSGIAR